MSTTSVLCWFRKSLRLADNPALLAASREATAKKCPLLIAFLLDTGIVASVGRARRRFLYDALVDVDARLRAVNSRLLVFSCDQLLASASPLAFHCVDGLDIGAPPMRAAAALCRLVEAHGVASVHFELCSEPYGSKRDRAVMATLAQRGVAVKRWASATLVDPRHLARVAGAPGAPLTYVSFEKLFHKAGGAELPLPAPSSLAPPPADLCRDESRAPATVAPPIVFADSAMRADEHVFLVGGETAGLARLARVTQSAAWVGNFEKPETSPYATSPPSTTLLSPYLKFGCVSPRTVYARLRECEQLCKKHSAPPVSLVGQMLWREHWMFIAAAVGDRFGAIDGNPVCRQIPWRDDEARFVAWRDGQTGYPIIDAAMRQLRRDGWIHHLARHSVACFATRGDLWLPWPKVAAVFDELLLDADFALNNANWMWLSASAFFHQFGRVYSPIAFPKKYGADAYSYVRKYVPELAHLSDKHILEPWTAPSDVRQRLQYPAPIVEHAVAVKENLDRMGAAYKDAACKARSTTAVPFNKPYADEPDTRAQLQALVTGAAASASTAATATAAATNDDDDDAAGDRDGKKKRRKV